MNLEHPRQRDPFITAIEAKITAWQEVLEKYKAAVALDRPLEDVANPESTRHTPNALPTDLPVGIFRDKGIKEAIPIYLSAGQRKQTNKEIAQGLQKGGIATVAVNFDSTVSTALSRLRKDGVVLRFADGWDLAASYPDSLRSRLTREPERLTTKPKDRKRQSLEMANATDDKTAAILKVVGAGGIGIAFKDIIAALQKQGIHTSPDYVRVVTKRLRKRGAIELKDGKFYPADTH